jgi:hypothetical protein
MEKCSRMFISRSQLDEHLLSCLHRNFHCPNKKLGCHKKLTFIESNDHSCSCLFAPLNCDKCGIYLQRKDLHDHAESCGKVEISFLFGQWKLRWRQLSKCSSSWLLLTILSQPFDGHVITENVQVSKCFSSSHFAS